jgi:hypothetical protein
MNLHRFSREVTEEEEAFGFGVTEAPSGIRAVIRELPQGLRAVKVEGDEGGVEYAICDTHLEPLYRPATSLRELGERFGR